MYAHVSLYKYLCMCLHYRNYIYLHGYVLHSDTYETDNINGNTIHLLYIFPRLHVLRTWLCMLYLAWTVTSMNNTLNRSHAVFTL